MDLVTAERSAKSVGIVTLLIGIALVAAPARVDRLLRTGGHAAGLRAIGASDLALVDRASRESRRSQGRGNRHGGRNYCRQSDDRCLAARPIKTASLL